MNRYVLCSVIASFSLSLFVSGSNSEPRLRFIVRVGASSDGLETGQVAVYNDNALHAAASYISHDPDLIAEQRAILNEIKRRNNALQDRTQAQGRRDSVRSMLESHIRECEDLIKTIRHLELNLAQLRRQQVGTYGNLYFRLERTINDEIINLSNARSRRDLLLNVIIPNALRADDAELRARAQELRNMR